RGPNEPAHSAIGPSRGSSSISAARCRVIAWGESRRSVEGSAIVLEAMSMSLKPILRFAPSPNGYLHLGHSYSALMTHGLAQKLGGTMLLRIEDIDLTRSKPEFTAAIFEDLRWLGLDWPEPVMRQSDRFAA